MSLDYVRYIKNNVTNVMDRFYAFFFLWDFGSNLTSLPFSCHMQHYRFSIEINYSAREAGECGTRQCCNRLSDRQTIRVLLVLLTSLVIDKRYRIEMTFNASSFSRFGDHLTPVQFSYRIRYCRFGIIVVWIETKLFYEITNKV